MMDSKLVNESIYILREAYFQFKNMAILWSTGKDSTASLSLCREAFLGKIPFPVIHIDTGYKFKQMYEFRDRIAKEWGFNLVVIKNQVAMDTGINPGIGKLECCTQLKTEALKKCLSRYGFDALVLAIRRDEHGIRAKERIFSQRNDEFTWDYKNQSLEMWSQFQVGLSTLEHMRVHPILAWSELDVWEYVKDRELPIHPMYFSNNGYRYRSLGCEPCTEPVQSNASTIDEIVVELKETKTAERAGRAQDKENTFAMAKMRVLGYM